MLRENLVGHLTTKENDVSTVIGGSSKMLVLGALSALPPECFSEQERRFMIVDEPLQRSRLGYNYSIDFERPQPFNIGSRKFKAARKAAKVEAKRARRVAKRAGRTG